MVGAAVTACEKETDHAIRHSRRYLHPGWNLTLLATRGPPLVTWRWALRDEGDDHDGRTGQYSGDQEHPAASF